MTVMSSVAPAGSGAATITFGVKANSVKTYSQKVPTGSRATRPSVRSWIVTPAGVVTFTRTEAASRLKKAMRFSVRGSRME
ncbi:hypothetical protein [Cereibacter sphaeroides]|uniref:hypothetical protein n=1 Tax=Cereibacter sphaeroides TaxID=1063 RepID=UPI001FFCB981|nr:hypothetical protein [Cereibacter sphaeroides]